MQALTFDLRPRQGDSGSLNIIETQGVRVVRHCKKSCFHFLQCIVVLHNFTVLIITTTVLLKEIYKSS